MNKSTPNGSRTSRIVLLLVLIAAGTIAAPAATFTVVNTNDSGTGSLRQAILDSNTNDQPDTITFDPSLFGTPQTIVLTTGMLLIERDAPINITPKTLTINGPGANLLTISGNNQSRVIAVDWQAQTIISGVKITEGNGVGGTDYFSAGGGILVKGGYIGDNVSLLTLRDSVISGNQGMGGGGGLSLWGTSTIINTAVTNNSSPTIGGGIHLLGDVRMINVTVSGNTTGVFGGGIYNDRFLTITNCTIANNQVTSANGLGAGIYLGIHSVIGTLNARNSIVARNKKGNEFLGDISGRVISFGYNIIGNTSEIELSGDTTGNQLDVNPLLDPLLSTYQSTIPYHALLAGSPAIDRGTNCVLNTTTDGGCLDTAVTSDQRGVSRPQDGDGNGTSIVDIGSIETTAAEIAFTPETPDLLPLSDSGISDTDNITNVQNPSFTVGGIVNGAMVEVMRDSTSLLTIIASGNTISFSDPEAPANGTFVYRVRQQVGTAVSPYSSLSVTIDTAAPTLTINQGASQADPTRSQPILFTGTLSETVIGFDQSDISLAGSTANVSNAGVLVGASQPTFDIQVSNLTGGGTVVASVPANRFQDIAGNNNPVSVSTDNSVMFDTSTPTPPPCGRFIFNQAPEFATGPNPKGVATADFDGDGKQDIAAAFAYSTQGFSILRNVGSNQFEPKIDFLIPSSAFGVESVFTKDLDGDGRIDIVISSWSSNRIAVFRNTSAGMGSISFAPRVDYVTGGYQSRSIIFGDFDGDGSPDIAIANRDTAISVSIFRNVSAGTGTITLAPRVDFPITVREVATGDFDGDGKLDIAAAGIGSVKILRNISTGPGNLGFTSSSSFNFSGGDANGIVVNDFDGDGKSDVVALTSTISVFRNISTGTGDINFAPRQNIITGPAPFSIVSSDFDSDGRPEIATANSNGNSVSIFRNTSSSPASITFGERQWDFGVGISPYDLATGDFNNDGKVDVVTPNREGNNVSVVINSSPSIGNVDFLARKDYVMPVGEPITNVDKADFDGDGNTDLAVSAERVFSVFRNDGAGHFLRTDVASSVRLSFLAADDFDSDGKTDLALLAVTEFVGSYGLIVYRNVSTGPGNISFQFIYGTSLWLPLRMSARDIDGDGKVDLVATHRPDGGSNVTAVVLRNTSNGPGSISFNQATSFASGANGANILVADLNADGKVDLTYNNSGVNSGSLTVQVNTGSGPGQISLEPQQIAISGVSFGRTLAEDLDGDGKKDLISSTEDNSLSIFRNTSAGGGLSFLLGAVYPNHAVIPGWVSDMDGDSKADLIASNPFGGGDYISIFPNESSGPGLVGFGARQIFAYGGSLNSGHLGAVLADDFNKDGRSDVVAGFEGASYGTLSVLLGKNCSSNRKASFDFDGDGKTDIGIFRPGPAEWWIQRSSNNSVFAAQFGATSDIMAPGDFTGDGKTDTAFFRPSTGQWFVLRSEDSSFYGFPFGANGDIPAPADYDGDGKTDPAVYRPSSASWYILRSSDQGVTSAQFGINGDKPVPADYDGDGKADIGIYRPNGGTGGEWWIQRSTAGLFAATFGNNADKTVQGDWTGDGKADCAFFRPSNGTWYVLRSEDQSFFGFPFGTSTDTPAPGDYDGDGKFDAGVFRQPGAQWFVNRSSGGVTSLAFGVAGDMPIPGSYVR